MYRQNKPEVSVIGYDALTRDKGQRLADATATLQRWNVTDFSALDALTASERLYMWQRDRLPAGNAVAEVPVIAPASEQLIQGRIDMLIESGGDFAIIDHKSFPGCFELWEERALGHAPSLPLMQGRSRQ
ncbi:hypothetical protein ACU8MP_33280 (plasmid) [Rhizobium leguminosarum]|nr:hypothetical protein [Rhizobium leguminosarum]MBA9034367.1 ATP-dependent exoDNAse (exonuclease V) beta subunit [Rhizobium leguminosarum]NKK85386.1 hypothetical protein [Rhizobium leguminosarum bv. viciae]